MDESGEPSRMLGVNMDVTERKLAERALAEMTRKLIEAQEQERAPGSEESFTTISINELRCWQSKSNNCKSIIPTFGVV